MGLIKSNPAAPGPLLFNLNDIEESARALVTRARAQADQVLAEARQQADHMRKSAHAEGVAQGRAEGLKQGKEQGHAQGVAQGKQAALAEQKPKLAELLTALTTAVAGLDSIHRSIEAAATQDVLELAVAIARCVCKALGTLDRAVLEANAKEAVRTILGRHAIRIAIHPTQRDALNELLPQFKLAWPQLQHVELLCDESIAPGGCLVSSGGGQVDATIDGQLNRLIEQLLPAAEPVPESIKTASVTQSMSADEVLD